jgi:hypothetical protein
MLGIMVTAIMATLVHDAWRDFVIPLDSVIKLLWNPFRRLCIQSKRQVTCTIRLVESIALLLPLLDALHDVASTERCRCCMWRCVAPPSCRIG